MYKGCCCLISLHSSCHVYRKHVTLKTTLMQACAVLSKRHGLDCNCTCAFLAATVCTIGSAPWVEHHMHRRETHSLQAALSWDEQRLSGSGAATGISVMFVWHIHPQLCCTSISVMFCMACPPTVVLHVAGKGHEGGEGGLAAGHCQAQGCLTAARSSPSRYAIHLSTWADAYPCGTC